MKNKKFYLKLFCAIVCSVVFAVNCTAVKVENYLWGDKYYLKSDEISKFRENIQSAFQKLDRDKVITEYIKNVAYVTITSEQFLEIQKVAIYLLLRDLEKWEDKNVDIIVSLPTLIQGWSIEEQ